MTRGKRITTSCSALVLAGCLLAAVPVSSASSEERDGGTPRPDGPQTTGQAAQVTAQATAQAIAQATAQGSAQARAQASVEAPARLPGGGRRIFARKRFLVAYYGTAGTGVLGVLGEGEPDAVHRRLVRAGKPFRQRRERVQPVYELIVTVADAVPGADGDYHHDISRDKVQTYIEAAERNGALLLLDLQPGRSDFLTVAKRWEWALAHPWVGLALDPEWRMGPEQVPGQAIGSVRAKEVNEVSAWLDGLTAAGRLPEKLFVVHQFQAAMVNRIRRVADRDHLAEVQHVDGFGTPSQKLATYRAVARPRQFDMGFKLFYDEDVPRMRAGAVRRIRPKVRFVSFQ